MLPRMPHNWFSGYLTNLFQLQKLYDGNMIMNSVEGWIWKEAAAMASLNILSWHLIEETEENH
jgi:hypothetical protein